MSPADLKAFWNDVPECRPRRVSKQKWRGWTLQMLPQEGKASSFAWQLDFQEDPRRHLPKNRTYPNQTEVYALAECAILEWLDVLIREDHLEQIKITRSEIPGDETSNGYCVIAVWEYMKPGEIDDDETQGDGPTRLAALIDLARKVHAERSKA